MCLCVFPFSLPPSAFLGTHDKVVRQAKRDGTYDTGVLTVKGPAVTLGTPEVVYTPPISLLPGADRALLASSAVAATDVATAAAAAAAATAAGLSRQEQQRQRDIVRGGKQSINITEAVVLHEAQVDRAVRSIQSAPTPTPNPNPNPHPTP